MTHSKHEEMRRLAINGDPEALTRLVRAYHDRLYRYGVHACRDPIDAEDAVQEAFIRLAKRPDVQQHPGALGWLLTVVRNACLRLLRPFLRERTHLGERLTQATPLPSTTLAPDAALEHWELIHQVHVAIARLERPYREVLVLRDLEGLSGTEVSDALGLPEASMKTRLHRARAQLREQLKDVIAPEKTVS